MADKILKSITFPGLSDKYVIPEATVDSVPTQDSTNAVGSNGTFTALQGKADKASLISGYFTAPIAGTGYISRDDGTVNADVSYLYSDYIDISGCDSLTTKSAYDSAFNAFYDSSKQFVSAFDIRTGTDLTVAIPANAVYMRVSATKVRYADANVFKMPTQSRVDAVETAVEALEDDIEAMSTATASDVGKALKAKTVSGGRVTEWEFGEAGGGDSANTINGYFTPPIEGIGNISREDGSVVTNAGYSYSDYIDISGYDKLTTRGTQGSAFNAFYDASKAFVGAFSVVSGIDQTIVIPANAVYMRVSGSTQNYNDTFIFKSLSRDNVNKIEEIRSAIEIISDQAIYIPLIVGTGYVAVNDATVPNGDIVSNSSYSHSDYINISDYDKLYIDSEYASSFNAFYNANKAFISAFSVAVGSNTITIPSTAVYIRVSNVTARFNATFVFKPIGHSNAVRISAVEDVIGSLEQNTDYFIPKIDGTGNISRDNGSVVTNADYSHSDYIDISRFGKLITVALSDGAFNAFYDSNKTFIEAFTVRTGTDMVITIPANAVYMRVSSLTTAYENTYRFRLLNYVNAVKISDLSETVDTLADSIAHSGDTFTPPIISTGNISRDDGSVVTNTDYSHSDYVDISDFKALTTYATVTGNFNAFYDSSKNFISAFTVRPGNGLTLDIPDNAVYMRVSTVTNEYYTTYVFGTIGHSNAVRIGELEDTVDNLLNGDSDYFSPPSAGTGNVSRDDGSISSSNYLHSDYIDISQYSRLITNAEVGSAFNAFYRADKTFIAPFSITAGADKNIEIPFGAMYMRVSAGNDVYDSVMKFRTLESITSDALPDYWYGHVVNKCESIRNNMNTIGKNGETFVFITDIHWYSNQQKSPKLIKYLLNNLNINMVFLGGDLIRQGTKSEEFIESMRCIKAFQYPDVFTPMAFGNHDNNSNQSDATQRFDANTVYSLFFKGFEDSVTWMTDTEFSFYFDKAVNKTRYIFLDMGDDGTSKAFTAFAPFRDALLSTPSGYKIVIVAHIIDYGTFTTSLTQMIDAYNARTSVTVNSVVCDFTSASGSVVICLGGHRHYDDEIATAGGVPITLTDCDAMLSVRNSQTAGTITEQAFDVVSLDYTNNLAYYERVGRNKSRIVHLTPVSASTTLTTSLSDTITWSSGDDSIATVSNGVITRVASGTVIIRADNGTETEIWVCNS